jgi:hypothetical protein
MRAFLCLLGCVALALAGCQVAPRSAGRKEAVRANAISNKHTVTEEPTLERAAPSVKEK